MCFSLHFILFFGGVFSYSSSFPIKMHATDAKTQKIKPDPNFFYEGRKVSEAVCKLEVVIDDQLSFTDHIATTARSCRFALYNIRKIRPFLSEQAAQLLSKLLFSPDWTIVMLSWRAFPHVLSSLCN